MTKARKSLIISILTLVIAVAVAATSTFAWFAMSTTPEIEGFEMNVTVSDDIYIAAFDKGVAPTANDVKKFKYNLATGDFVIPAETKLDALTPKLKDATTGAELAEAGFALTALDGTDAATTAYYEFDLYFLSTKAYKINLDVAKLVVTSTDSGRIITAIDDIGTTVKAGDRIKADAANAARIGFTSGATTTVVDPNRAEANSWTVKETTANVAHELFKQTFNTALGDAITNKLAEKEFTGTKDKTNVAATPVTTLVATQASDELYKAFSENGTEVPSFTSKVTLSIWLEGKDADCFNSIYNDVLKVAMGFTGTI